MTSIALVLTTALVLVLLVLAWLALRSRVMFKLGLRPIMRRRTQSSLIILGLMLGTLIITAAFVTGDTLSHTIRSLIIEELGPIDEMVHVRTDNSMLRSSYFNLSRYETIAEQLQGYPNIDAIVPGIRESIPAVNITRRQSTRAVNLYAVRAQDAALILPEEELRTSEGHMLLLEGLEAHQIYLNQSAAEALGAQPGDQIKLYAGSSPRIYVVAGISQGANSARVYLNLDQAQRLFSKTGRINLIMISNLGDSRHGARYNEQVSAYLRGLLSDDYAVRRLYGWLVEDNSTVTAIRSAAIRYQGNTRTDLLNLAAGLEAGIFNEEIRSLLADETLGAEIVSILDQADWQSESKLRRLETQFGRLSDFSVLSTKRDGLDEAEMAANAFTAIFIVTGLFGIASGLLLIFLIFVMLAAERKSEMGMTRAIGAQRSHLVQMFVFEGTAYDLVAAAVGVALGLLVGLVIAYTMGQAFASQDLQIRPMVTVKSLAVSYTLGMLVTFITVLFSANRVSRLNIVSAIRNLPEPAAQPVPLKERLLAPLKKVLEGFRQLFRLKIWRAIKTWMFGVPKSLLKLIWTGFRSGILTFLLGLLLAPAGLSASSGSLFTFGFSLALIGGGLVLRGILYKLFPRKQTLADRIAFSAMGVLLLFFWSLPSDVFEIVGIVDLKAGAEMLFIAGFMMIVGAVMVVMYNTDLLLKGILLVLGGNRRLAPVLRMAVAYPMANRFRTGLTLGMFGIVVFSVVFMATAFKANHVLLENTEALTGGYELRAQTSALNPVPNLQRSASRDPKLREMGFDVITSESMMTVELKQDDQAWSWYRLRAVDETYLDTVGYDFAVMAEGYESPEEIWQALRTHPGYAVIDSYGVSSRQSTSIVVGGPEFKLQDIYLEDESMQPTQIQVRDSSGELFEVTIIGVLDQMSGVSFSVFTSQETLENGLTNPPVPTQYYIKLADTIDPQAAAAALESAFLDYGLEAVDQVQELKDAQQSQLAIEKLMLGFLTLGLIVGVAALGVISSRSVVERRQQIGVLRALGFQGSMVTWSFLIEASFVALLGITLGVVLALIPASQMIDEMVGDLPGLTFQVPWGSILLVVGLAYSMSLLATWLPSRQASKVSPAEALRYE
ncbi:MAG: FtsX-like permease family protein [Anaerolineales bacterium]|nr:FtsX-like permease family protein [Anaerolineales bacterium]